MDYSIGNLSALLDLSVEGIRNYEKQDIIRSERTDAAYRRYQYLDITSLVRARIYRSMGFTLKQISAMTNEMSPAEIAETFRERLRELREEDRIRQGRISLMEDYLSRIEQIDDQLDQPALTVVPGYYRMEFSRNGEVDFGSGVDRRFREWMGYLPFVHVSTRYHGDDVFGGLAIEERYASLFGISEGNGVSYHRQEFAVSMLVREGENGHSRKECTDRLVAFAGHHRLIPLSDPIGHTRLGIHKRDGYVRYRAIYIPIRAE